MAARRKYPTTDDETPTEAKRREAKNDICTEHMERRIGWKQAEAQLYDLGYSQWEVELFLYNDQTGPE